MGLADMLLARPDGRPAFGFTGRLPFDWPAGDCLPKSGGIQFRRGYGLSLSNRSKVGRLPETPPVMACPAESR
jgi:beta-glucosidase